LFFAPIARLLDLELENNLVRNSGYTLIELVATLILVAIIALVAIPRGPDSTPSLAAQAEQLISDIRYVQSLAISRGVRHRLCLAAAGYTIATTSCGTPIAHPATGNTTPIGFTGVTLSSSLPNDYVAFDTAGVPYSTDPGTALTGNATITLTSNQGGSRAITVSPETGRAASP
jgi:MSHA pilin protein MshC